MYEFGTQTQVRTPDDLDFGIKLIPQQQEGDEAVVSGWIAVHVEAAAARRRMERRIDIGELDRVDGDAKVVVGAKNALYVNARG